MDTAMFCNLSLHVWNYKFKVLFSLWLVFSERNEIQMCYFSVEIEQKWVFTPIYICYKYTQKAYKWIYELTTIQIVTSNILDNLG